MLAEHRVQARGQVGTTDQFEDVVGAIAEGHLVRLDVITLGQAALELEAIAIRVAGEIGQFGTDGLENLGLGPSGFVAGQLDDAGRVEVQLTGQLVNRLAGYVGRKFLHARLCQGEKSQLMGAP